MYALDFSTRGYSATLLISILEHHAETQVPSESVKHLPSLLSTAVLLNTHFFTVHEALQLGQLSAKSI